MTELIQVVTTFEKREDAERVARAVIENRLAACAQILGPMTSVYWWQGRVETAGEFLCQMKTRRGLWPELEAFVREHHPYTTPEILAFPVIEASKPYADWLVAETKRS